MTMSTMRREVSTMYDNDTWREKVKKMPDNQVMAIYFRMKGGKK